jgi:type II secretory ATPase GspE/PulE/Tfp pilus assembly ATPase PilB-like protein
VLVVSEADYQAFVAANLSGQAASARDPARPQLATLLKQVAYFLAADREDDAKAATAAASSQDVVALASTLFLKAIQKNASDIHFEPIARESECAIASTACSSRARGSCRARSTRRCSPA